MSKVIVNEAFEESLKKKLSEAGSGSYLSKNGGPRAHRLIARVAKSFCNELYEIYCSKIPKFRDRWPHRKVFAAEYWPMFTEEARESLAIQLTQGSVREEVKEEIYEALMRDFPLKAHRSKIPQVRLDK